MSYVDLGTIIAYQKVYSTYSATIKIRSVSNETVYMNVSVEQLERIAEVLDTPHSNKDYGTTSQFYQTTGIQH